MGEGAGRQRRALRPPRTSEVDAAAPQLRVRGLELLSRPACAERCCPSHSPALRPWIARSASYVEGSWSPALLPFRKSQAKAAGNYAANSACAKRRRTFLSEAGPRSGTGLSQPGHHSLDGRGMGVETTKATLSDRLRSGWLCG